MNIKADKVQHILKLMLWYPIQQNETRTKTEKFMTKLKRAHENFEFTFPHLIQSIQLSVRVCQLQTKSINSNKEKKKHKEIAAVLSYILCTYLQLMKEKSK